MGGNQKRRKGKWEGREERKNGGGRRERVRNKGKIAGWLEGKIVGRKVKGRERENPHLISPTRK